jgi:hypothetical protein
MRLNGLDIIPNSFQNYSVSNFNFMRSAKVFQKEIRGTISQFLCFASGQGIKGAYTGFDNIRRD